MRRIVAVTRGLAHAAVERANSFEQQLDAADGVDDLSLDTTVSLWYISPEHRTGLSDTM